MLIKTGVVYPRTLDRGQTMRAGMFGKIAYFDKVQIIVGGEEICLNGQPALCGAIPPTA